MCENGGGGQKLKMIWFHVEQLVGLKRLYRKEHVHSIIYIYTHDIYTNHMYFANHGWLFDDIFFK